MDEIKRSRQTRVKGRPRLAEGQVRKTFTVRLTPAQIEGLDVLCEVRQQKAGVVLGLLIEEELRRIERGAAGVSVSP